MTFIEMTRAAGLTKGAAHRPLQELVTAGIVGKSASGTVQYWTEPSAFEALDAVIRNLQPVGSLKSGQALMLVVTTAIGPISEALRETDITAIIVWAALLDPDGGRYLCVLSDTATAVQVGRMRSRFEAAGAKCTSFRVDGIVGPEAFQRFADALSDARGGAN